MTTRLVSFLGLGPLPESPYYTPIKYEIDGKTSVETPLIEKAICQVLKPIDSIVVLGTQEVRERWIDTKLFQEITGREPLFVLVPHGSTTDERWEVFQKTVDALSHQAIEAAGEDEIPGQIVMDVTHGFRSQPIFGIAAVNYILSEWSRQQVTEPPNLQILYGSFDDRDQEKRIAPIWDLTELVKASHWNAALNALMRFGRADDLDRFGKQEKKHWVEELKDQGKKNRELRQANFAKRFGEAAKQFADDLALNRLRDLIVGSEKSSGSAQKLLDVLSDPGRIALEQRLPPLKNSLDQLEHWLSPLCAEDTLGESGLKASVALAHLYGRLQRFAEQAAVIREGLITHFALTTKQHPIVEPGPGCSDARAIVENDWRDLSKLLQKSSGRSFPKKLEANAKLSNSIVSPRNDIEHCGINNDPSPAHSLRKQLSDRCDEFKALLEVEECFINLSNHPIETWSKEQIRTARELNHGEPINLDGGMPDVNPEANIEEIESIAVEIADCAARQGATGAFVSTEYTLTVALIHELQERFITCYSATTKREVEEIQTDDGATEKKALFRFVAWRAYPKIESSKEKLI